MFDDDDFLGNNVANPFESGKKPPSVTGSLPASSPPGGNLNADSNTSYTGGNLPLNQGPGGTDGTVQDYLSGTGPAMGGGNVSPGGGGNGVGAAGTMGVGNGSIDQNANGVAQLPDLNQNLNAGGGNTGGGSPIANNASKISSAAGGGNSSGDQDGNTAILRQILESSLRQEETLQKLCNQMINLNTRVVDLEQVLENQM
jgi:hypothetical protein